jgi:hypothetical protein
LLPQVIKDQLAAAGYSDQPYNRRESHSGYIRGQAVGRDQAVNTASDIPVSAYSTDAQGRPNDWYRQDVFFKLMCAALGGC